MTVRCRKHRGVALASALCGLFILMAATTVVLQAYLTGARTLRAQGQRDAAARALEAQLETLLAGGYAKLPATGSYPIPPTALPALHAASGTLTVALGPAPDTRQVTAQVTWDAGGPRREQLAMVMARRGAHP
jgi:hypothetical protein